MGIIGWIILGLIAGVLAKLIMPGRDAGGFILTIILTILIGIAGGLLGGFIGNVLGFHGVQGLNIASILWAVLGAVILLALYRMFAGRRV